MTPRECGEDIPEDELARMAVAESVLGLEFDDEVDNDIEDDHPAVVKVAGTTH